jgi:RNA polymerase sigma-70 factor (sigma-E family)
MKHDADFAELYAAAWPRLFRTTYAVTGDLAAAEDALQTAFALAYKSWRRVSSAEDPIAYLRRMAVNAALAQHRKVHKKRERLTDRLPDRAVPDAGGDLFDRGEVWAAVQALAPRQRAVVVLRYYEGLSEREIADALGCRPGTVKSQASAALANLRDHLAGPVIATGGAA